MRRAIIGGTGVYGISDSAVSRNVSTPFGEVSVDILTLGGNEIVFLPRHGKKHGVPPHLINYRANMMALKQLEVSYIYATCAVGSCNTGYEPGDVVILTDFLDFTKSRAHTFHDGSDGVKHTDMSDPYCGNLRGLLKQQAGSRNVAFKGNAVYVCTEGPRFETAAEIKMYRSMGGDVVGMTNIPEVNLAKELGMCYAAAGIVTNWCTGIHEEVIAMHDITAALEKNKQDLTTLFLSILIGQLDQNHCSCAHAVMELGK